MLLGSPPDLATAITPGIPCAAREVVDRWYDRTVRQETVRSPKLHVQAIALKVMEEGTKLLRFQEKLRLEQEQLQPHPEQPPPE